jgi:ATP-binding cassette subfamily B protein
MRGGARADLAAGGKTGDLRLLLRLLAGTPRELPRLALALVIQLATTAMMLATPVILQKAIDGPISHRRTEGLALYAAGYLVLLLLVFAASWWREYLMLATGERIINHWRCRIFSHILHLPVPFFDRQKVGALVTRATNDVEVLNDFFSSGAIALVRDTLTLIGIMVAMTLYHPKLALLTFSVVPALLLMAWLFNRLVRRYFRETRSALAALNGHLAEALGGIEAIKAFGAEGYRRRRFREVNRSYLDLFLKTVFVHSIFWPAIGLLNAVAWALVAWQGGKEVIAGALTIGILAAFIEYIRMFFRPIMDLSQQFDVIQSALAASERVFGILDHPEETDRPEAITGRPDKPLTVSFRDVWFAYRGEEWVLSGVSLTIPSGGRVALIGQTGSGKTSIIHLLNRFYEPQRGEILLGGRPLTSWRLADLRRTVGLISQDVVLFPGTILQNLRRVAPDLTPGRAEELFSLLGADRLLARLPEGLQTTVAGGGLGLSAGERQLLALVRALAADPPFLVMDEATSRIDPETDEMIRLALTRLLEGRTALVVAHRLTTIREADRVAVIHQGRVAEEGPPRELEGKNGLYRAYLDLAVSLAGDGEAPPERLGAGGEPRPAVDEAEPPW